MENYRPDFTPITSDEMYRIEENGDSIFGMRRVMMMENAGHGVADFIAAKFRDRLKSRRIVAVCGTGNNGGDAFVASRHLAGYGARPTVILLGSPSYLRSEEAKTNWSIIEKMDSIEIIFGSEITPEVKNRILSASIIIDGIFGTGIKGQIRDPHGTAIDLINQSKAYVVAVDVPSGLDPNTGQVQDRCVMADATVTFHRKKRGLVDRGRDKGTGRKKNGSHSNSKIAKYTGRVYLELIGIPPEAEKTRQA
jgi:NAD(P)H-hydrate epimerase